MQWELWDVETGNLVGWRETEADALALVRELVLKGWPVDALSLIVDDPALADEDLPPGVTGAELARRTGLTGPDQTRRTA